MRRAAGFTLIEVMVVLVIAGLLATGFSLSLDALHGRERSQALKRLRLVLEASAERAAIRGRPVAFEPLADGYRFSAQDADGRWRPLEDPPVFSDHGLPAGLRWAGLTVDGQPAAEPPRLVFGADSPAFELLVDTPEGRSRLSGRASGSVALSGPGLSGK